MSEHTPLTETEVENHRCCMKRNLCREDHFHQRDVERILAARTSTATADTPTLPFTVRVPMDRLLPNDDGERLNIGTQYVDVQVILDPTMEKRGECRYGAYGGPVIALREWDEQVYLHELLHAATGYCQPRLEDSHPPEGHDVISRIEVALWETGWRFTATADTEGCWQPCDPDCEVGPIHCEAVHLPSHKAKTVLHTAECVAATADTGLRERVEAVRALAQAAKPAISKGPLDCKNTCWDGDCTCSGQSVPLGWTLNPTEVLAALDAAPASTEDRADNEGTR